MSRPARLRVAAALAMAAALLLPAAAHAAPGAVRDQTLRYAVTYDGRNAGEIEVVIRNEDDGCVVTSTSKPSLLASLFVKASVSRTRFVRRHGALVLDRGDERLTGADGHRRGFRFDHARRRILFSDGDHYAMQPGDQFEAAAFPLLLMLRPVADVAGARVREVSARRTREYRYERPVAEQVRIPAGTFPGWKITRHRSDRPADVVTVWLARAADPVPLKIAVRKRGRTTTLRLTGP